MKQAENRELSNFRLCHQWWHQGLILASYSATNDQKVGVVRRENRHFVDDKCILEAEQSTNHWFSQWWPRTVTPYDVIMSQVELSLLMALSASNRYLSGKFHSKQCLDLVDGKSASIGMIWRLLGAQQDKALSKLIVTKFTDNTFIHYPNSIRLCILWPPAFIVFENLQTVPTDTTLQWRHNERVSNHRQFDCLLYHLFRRRSRKTSKLRVTGLC